jgi:hypothetical protein
MAGKLNITKLKNKILNSREVKQAVFKKVNEEVQKQKADLLSEFSEHPVTQELEGGESASNISNTLGGYGNLFSFIGFKSGSTPTARVKTLLRNISVNKTVKVSGDKLNVTVKIPSREELEGASKIPWENGRSWLFDMNKSISGLGSYIYGRFNSSRSGTGIQTKINFGKRVFSPVSYFESMYNNFVKRVQNIK